MEIIQWRKMQIMCLLILVYIGCTYLKDGNYLKNVTPKSYCNKSFDVLFVIAEIAVLFDAISAKRCYRDAMPLDKCYRIIQEGRGEDFDPDVVDSFLADKSKVEEILFHASVENHT